MSNKLPSVDVQQAILQTVRAFPTISVRIYHARFVRIGLGQSTPLLDATTLAYQGEAIFFGAGETVMRLALGTVELSTPVLVLPTSRAVLLRDLVVIDHVMYEVTATTDFALGGTVLNLKQFQQGA